MAHHQDSTHPTGVNGPVGGHVDHSAVSRSRSRKANAALQMRLGNATWDEIAQALGYPTPRAALVATERALEKELANPEDREKLRKMAGARLERLIRSVWTKAIDPANPEHLVAVGKARDLIDRHAKLYGLDAPTEVVVHNPTQAELEAWVAKVTAVVIPSVDEADIFDIEEVPLALPAD